MINILLSYMTVNGTKHAYDSGQTRIMMLKLVVCHPQSLKNFCDPGEKTKFGFYLQMSSAQWKTLLCKVIVGSCIMN